jgi:hypothetical protein
MGWAHQGLLVLMRVARRMSSKRFNEDLLTGDCVFGGQGVAFHGSKEYANYSWCPH